MLNLNVVLNFSKMMKKNVKWMGVMFFALTILVSCKDDGPVSKIWSGKDITFTRAADVDWTLPENQDYLSKKVSITRQSNGAIYNYTFWQDTFGEDATFDDLYADFWNDIDPLVNKDFVPVGGVHGVRFAILDNTGSTGWPETFDLYGTLGDPTNFYSLHSIATMISQLNNGNLVVSVPDDFSVTIEGGNNPSGTNMPALVGKKLGVWLVEEDRYLTLSFTDWGSGGSGSFAYTRSTR